MDQAARHIEIRGLVQGVGFRPFIFRLAGEWGLRGWVDNRADCVSIHVEGDVASITGFLADIRRSKPLPAIIHSIEVTDADREGYTDFHIRPSDTGSGDAEITEVSPDIAVCGECLDDMGRQEHRIDYPFINCTNCGPRFTIIRDLPYDRPRTTMADFPMCDTCRSEYDDIRDRRFHAQPVACLSCGPGYTLHEGGKALRGTDAIIHRLCAIIEGGGIVAFKGMGGYNLACDAFDQEAVTRLRALKAREGKPFAVMFGDIDTAGKYVAIDPAGRELLGSWRRPIVLLPRLRPLADAVNNGFEETGVMLPSLPIHHLLFRDLGTPAIVLTSGNISDEPIVIDDAAAMATFAGKADAVLSNDRDIHNRCDDSVTAPFRDTSIMIRRSRGYAPSPVRLPFDVDGILATGAELVNCFAIGKGSQAILSQHQGDLKNFETYEFFRESVGRFSRLFRFEPRLVATDLHPDYLSTRFGKDLGLETIGIQHHHAHIASVMAEHGHAGPVIGVSMDGTGLGTDGHTWGAEFLVCDYRSFERRSHFAYVPLPGGDRVVREPWRTAYSYLIDSFGDEADDVFGRLFPEADTGKAALVARSIRQRINAPLSDSAGRLFDAVAALSGACRESGFHAEAPMRLEALATSDDAGTYPVDDEGIISFRPMIRAIVADLLGDTPPALVASRFHRSLALTTAVKAAGMAAEQGINTVALSGGVFQNRKLLSLTLDELHARGLETLFHQRIPSNDGGLALGQLAIAAHQR